MKGNEISFEMDKYNKPVYLSKRESVAQIVVNALFMKPGNNLSHPDRYVDIERYLSKPVDTIDSLQILGDLKKTCGDDLIGNEISSLTFDVVKSEDKEYALIMVNLTIDNTEDIMAIALQREKDNVIRYQYSFINDDVPV